MTRTTRDPAVLGQDISALCIVALLAGAGRLDEAEPDALSRALVVLRDVARCAEAEVLRRQTDPLSGSLTAAGRSGVDAGTSDGGSGAHGSAGRLDGATPPLPDTSQTPAAAWHIGRAWSGHDIEDACPCPQEPCGLVNLSRVDLDCDQHSPARARSIRQGHRADHCPVPAGVLEDAATAAEVRRG